MSIVLAVRRKEFVLVAADSRLVYTSGPTRVERTSTIRKVVVHPRLALMLAVAGASPTVLAIDEELRLAMESIDRVEQAVDTLQRFFNGGIVGSRIILATYGEAVDLVLLKRETAGWQVVSVPTRGSFPAAGLESLYEDGRWAAGPDDPMELAKQLHGEIRRGIAFERTLRTEDQCFCGGPIRVAIVDAHGARLLIDDDPERI